LRDVVAVGAEQDQVGVRPLRRLDGPDSRRVGDIAGVAGGRDVEDLGWLQAGDRRRAIGSRCDDDGDEPGAGQLDVAGGNVGAVGYLGNAGAGGRTLRPPAQGATDLCSVKGSRMKATCQAYWAAEKVLS
jgi:hypothetical protein